MVKLALQMPPAPVVDPRLWDNLREFVTEVMLLQHSQARRCHFSLTQYLLLRHLRAEGPQRLSDLALRFGVSRPAITSAITGLENGGWVLRQPTRGDRRVVLTRLTPKAERALRRVDAERAERLGALLEGIRPSEQARVAETLLTAVRPMRGTPSPGSPSLPRRSRP